MPKKHWLYELDLDAGKMLFGGERRRTITWHVSGPLSKALGVSRATAGYIFHVGAAVTAIAVIANATKGK